MNHFEGFEKLAELWSTKMSFGPESSKHAQTCYLLKMSLTDVLKQSSKAASCDDFKMKLKVNEM